MSLSIYHYHHCMLSRLQERCRDAGWKGFGMSKKSKERFSQHVSTNALPRRTRASPFIIQKSMIKSLKAMTEIPDKQQINTLLQMKCLHVTTELNSPILPVLNGGCPQLQVTAPTLIQQRGCLNRFSTNEHYPGRCSICPSFIAVVV